MLSARLLLRVSRRSSRSLPLRAVIAPRPLIKSFSGGGGDTEVLLNLRRFDPPRPPCGERERDLDLEDEPRLLLRRCLGGGDGLLEPEGDLLRLFAGGDLDRDTSEGV
jgi:hypothetical protein